MRHVQVLRLQPGDAITLFGNPDDPGAEYAAQVQRMGRNSVEVEVLTRELAAREPKREVHLAVGVPANERMDWLVEKATELGVASIQPLMTAHSVLRLKGERADKKQVHWQAIAVAACEQCGGNVVPQVHAPQHCLSWLHQSAGDDTAAHWVLSLQSDASPLLSVVTAPPGSVWLLSGPEGGLSPTEEEAARASGWQAHGLGPRVLRAEPAALAALAALLLNPGA